MVFIMKGGSEVIAEYFIYFIFEQDSNAFVSHEVVEHFQDDAFIFIGGVGRIDSGEFEDFSFGGPGDVGVVEEFEAIRGIVFDDYCFDKADLIAEAERHSCSVFGGESYFRPLEGYICFEVSS